MFFGHPFGGIIPGVRGAVLSALLRTGQPLTGRQIHRLVSDHHSLWSVQECLKDLLQLGLVEYESVGRANVYVVNQSHSAVPSLRSMVNPMAALTAAIRELVAEEVESVLIFGSVARGEAHPDSDVDLAVIAAEGWEGRADLAEMVYQRLGNQCDVLVFTRREFLALVADGERVVADILRDGFALIGEKPMIQSAGGRA